MESMTRYGDISELTESSFLERGVDTIKLDILACVDGWDACHLRWKVRVFEHFPRLEVEDCNRDQYQQNL